VNLKNMKKLLNWCLNARAYVAKQPVNLESFDSNIPDRAREESEEIKTPEWFRKVSTRVLFVDIFFTFFFSISLVHFGINQVFLLAGFFIALLSTVLFWNAQMQRYDALIKQPYFDHRNMEIMFVILAAASMLPLYYYTQELTQQSLLSFFGGLLVVSFWFSYLQLIYWERNNHKVIYKDKGLGTWKSYIILERK